MTTTQQLAKHLRDVHFGGNWTWSNVKDQLTDVSVETAMQKVEPLNTIAALTFHINYYVKAIINVLEGSEINAHDKFSYDHPHFETKEEWKISVSNAWMTQKSSPDLLKFSLILY